MATIGKIIEEAILRCWVDILETTASFKGKNLNRGPFLIELATFSLQISSRGTLVQLFFLKFCQNFLNSFLTHQLQLTAPKIQ